MAFDLAIDFVNGDLMVAANNDLDIRTGKSDIEQRIRVRLRIFQGEWTLDPTGGTLGSTLHDAVRLPTWRALGEIPLIVREALAPMADISVRDVDVMLNPNDVRAVDIVIAYTILDEGEPAEEQSLALTTTIAG